MWLEFERLVKERSTKDNLLTIADMTEFGEKCGITETGEVLEVVRFLSDLGSLQYFETNGLKDKVVIKPQVSHPSLGAVCRILATNFPVHF